MYLRKEATVLISTVIILSLISTLGFSMYKMMKNNKEIENIYKFDTDIYDFNKDEEEILNKFMEQLNKNREDKLREENENNQLNRNESESEILQDKNDDGNVFSEDFTIEIEVSSLEYHKNNDKIFMISNKVDGIGRRREIKYIFRDEKVILIPTYKFKDNSE